MKKFLLLFLILLQGFAFAQSRLMKMANGYRDTYWQEPLTEVLQSKQLKKGADTSNYSEYLESARMMKENTNVSYVFEKNKLVAIGYSLDYTKDKKDRLLSNMKKNGYIIKETKNFDGINFDKNFLQNILDEGKTSENKPLTEDDKKQIKEQIESYNTFNNFLVIEDLKTYEKESDANYNNIDECKSISYMFFNQPEVKEDEYQLITAQYREFTNVYIYSNFINKIFVVYTEIEEDEF